MGCLPDGDSHHDRPPRHRHRAVLAPGRSGDLNAGQRPHALLAVVRSGRTARRPRPAHSQSRDSERQPGDAMSRTVAVGRRAGVRRHVGPSDWQETRSRSGPGVRSSSGGNWTQPSSVRASAFLECRVACITGSVRRRSRRAHPTRCSHRQRRVSTPRISRALYVKWSVGSGASEGCRSVRVGRVGAWVTSGMHTPGDGNGPDVSQIFPRREWRCVAARHPTGWAGTLALLLVLGGMRRLPIDAITGIVG